jgi:hypothetical protein
MGCDQRRQPNAAIVTAGAGKAALHLRIIRSGIRILESLNVASFNPARRRHSDIIASLALKCSPCRRSTPPRTATEVDEAPTHANKSDARIAVIKTLARTASVRKSLHFFAVEQIHRLGRADEH